MLRFTSLSVKQIKTSHFSHVHLPFGIQMKHTIPYSESTDILKNNLISLDVQVSQKASFRKISHWELWYFRAENSL